MAYVIITYYTDGTELVQECGDSEERAQVYFQLQRDAMQIAPGTRERVQIAQIVKDTE